jgi:membrane protein
VVFVDRFRGAARGIWNLGLETYEQWRDHRTIRLGAGLAYYGLFAIVPVLAVALAFAGAVISQGDVQSYLAEQLSALFGVDADTVATALAGVLDGDGRLAGLGLIGAASLLLTASVLVVALQDAFNTIWERPVRSGLRQTVMRRLVAFVVVAGAGAVIIVSFAVNAVTGLLDRLAPDIAIVGSLQELIGLVTSWVLAIGVVALLFRYLTDVRVPWPPALVGGVFTAAVLAVGTVLLGAYLRRYAASSLAGATGSVFLVLLWIFYVAQMVLVGAEFTRVLSRRHQADGWVGAASSAAGDGEASSAPCDDAAVDVDC